MTNTLSKAPNFVQGSPRSRIGTQRYPCICGQAHAVPFYTEFQLLPEIMLNFAKIVLFKNSSY